MEVIEKQKIRISVRSLVEFVFRSGDIDNRVGKGVVKEAMQQGSRMHRKIQKRQGSGYHAEVSLKHERIMGHYLLSVEGRADGIFRKSVPVGIADSCCNSSEEIVSDFGQNIGNALQSDDGKECDAGALGEKGERPPFGDTFRRENEIDFSAALERAESIEQEQIFYIDEIKCMYTDVTRFERAQTVHLAQAKCYAYIFALQNGLARIGVQITYCDLDTEELKQFEEIYDFPALEAWFEDVIASYRKWTDFQYEWNLIRRDSIKPLEFPFPYREGQRKLTADVYRTMARKKILFLQAPTGTGKTMATVFPAVKAVGEGLADKIFYLTAKTITRTVAAEAFSILKERGLRGKVITITAKEKLCPLDEMDCNPVSCPYAKGHYDRVNDAVYDLITKKDDFSREICLKQAEKYLVCPFEMALDASIWSDAIICDYNYVFDPNVYLKRFFAEGEHGDYIFLIDEAHNLVDRGREMYSAVLVKEDFLKMKRIMRNYSKKITSVLEKCNRQMLEWKRGCEDYTVFESIGNFAFSLMRLMSLLDDFLRKRVEFPERKDISEFYLNLRHFMNMFDGMDENYAVYADFDGEGRFCLHLFCVNPAANLQQCLDKGRSAVFFSATLLPVQYYKNLLSTNPDNYAVYAESTFDSKKRLLFLASDVSSLYTMRTPAQFQRIARYIQTVAAAKKGNYIAFFPSYRFMADVYEQFEALNQGKTDCLMQDANMREAEREAFMAEFEVKRERSLVAFCVLGGIFSEGIDLKHERLIGALIVGTGLPQICNEREVLKKFYDGTLMPVGEETENDQRLLTGETVPYEKKKEGFAYAYQYPGMNKVLQAAGRVIRTADDCGVIGLLDMRFLRREYSDLFPREWNGSHVCNLRVLPRVLAEFWEKW